LELLSDYGLIFKECAYFRDWFDFVLSGVIHVVSWFLVKICLHI